MQKIKFAKALIKSNWQDDVTLTLNDQGRIDQIKINDPTGPSDEITYSAGYALPGFANIHSHAFQRAMTGLAEYSTSQNDSFWTWRDVMYRFAQKITPDDLYHIARQLYLEMVMAGYSSVAEFHYLHHQPDGQPYDNPAEMSLALTAAAEDVGIALTLLPVLYQASGFGGQPLQQEQARFGHTTNHYCRLLDQLNSIIARHQAQTLGVAFHSLRAVHPDSLNDVISHLNSINECAPRHIHIAEQIKEVDDCLLWSGQRPVEWLLNNQSIDQRWCLIHATHLNDNEVKTLAKSGAIAGICPTTEANLGDGLFPLKSYLDQGGAIAIGSDSHISVNPIEELRLLEYGQRLKYNSRNVTSTPSQPHCGMALYHNTSKGSAPAMGRDMGEIAVGKYADIITLDPDCPTLFSTPDDFLLDRVIFNGNISPIRDVMIGGRWKVSRQQHPLTSEITTGFKQTMARLL